MKNGKYYSKHTIECRKRFEQIMQRDAGARGRFERATERRLAGITRRTMDIQEQVEAQATAAGAEAPAGAASGSGLTEEARQEVPVILSAPAAMATDSTAAATFSTTAVAMPARKKASGSQCR